MYEEKRRKGTTEYCKKKERKKRQKIRKERKKKCPLKRILSFAKGNRAEKKIGAKKEKKEGRKVLVKLGNRGKSLGKYDKGRKGGWRGEKGEPEFSAIRCEGGLKKWGQGGKFFSFFLFFLFFWIK